MKGVLHVTSYSKTDLLTCDMKGVLHVTSYSKTDLLTCEEVEYWSLLKGKYG